MLVLTLAVLGAGCSQHDLPRVQRLAPGSAASVSLPPPPLAGEPSPLTQTPPFGLYAAPPSNATLQSLSTGTVSPDGRFRTAFTDQGLWVARIDGAWLWHVQVPAPPSPEPQALPGTHLPSPPARPAQPPKPPAPSGGADWTPRSSLLFRDDAGTWHEADPVQARVTALPAALQGKENITFSTDGKQVLYYTPGRAGRQLWVAAVDGSKPLLVGENLTGFWRENGELLTARAAPPAQQNGTHRPAETPQ